MTSLPPSGRVRLPLATPLIAFLLTAPGVVAQVSTVTVSDSDNAADSNGHGAVAATFSIGLTEVTNTEYVAFLNAVAADDPGALFDEDIMTDSDRGGILRSGSAGSYTYALKTDFGDKPVNGVDWSDAARFCNWLHHGQPTGAQGAGTTEDGAYDMSLAAAAIVRQDGARWFLPSEDQWYKAAYHDPVDPGADASGTLNYWRYPTRSDSQPAQATASATGDVGNPGAQVANFDQGADWNGENGNVTTVGSAGASSFWGLLDAAGNVMEWTEALGTPISPTEPTRLARGGDFNTNGVIMQSGFDIDLNMTASAANVGFRVATHLPWTYLGNALAGTSGDPVFVAEGPLTSGGPLTIELRNAFPSVFVFLVVGFVDLSAPFKGGVLLPDPSPPGFVLSFSTSGTGEIVLNAIWPAGVPSAFTTYFQYWIPDAAGPQGFSATNAISGTTP